MRPPSLALRNRSDWVLLTEKAAPKADVTLDGLAANVSSAPNCPQSTESLAPKAARLDTKLNEAAFDNRDVACQVTPTVSKRTVRRLGAATV